MKSEQVERLTEQNGKLRGQVWRLEKNLELRDNQICVLESEIKHLRSVHSLEIKKTNQKMQILQDDHAEQVKMCNYYKGKSGEIPEEKTSVVRGNRLLTDAVKK